MQRFFAVFFPAFFTKCLFIFLSLAAVGQNSPASDDLNSARVILTTYAKIFPSSYRKLITLPVPPGTPRVTEDQLECLIRSVSLFSENAWLSLPFYPRLAVVAILSEGFPTFPDRLMEPLKNTLSSELQAWIQELNSQLPKIKRNRKNGKLSVFFRQQALYYWFITLILREHFVQPATPIEQEFLLNTAPLGASINDVYSLPPKIRTLILLHLIQSSYAHLEKDHHLELTRFTDSNDAVLRELITRIRKVLSFDSYPPSFCVEKLRPKPKPRKGPNSSH